ncbi:winged helix-turn-helix transcriptional regulator [Acinetobacter baumannii]|uniref:winged helix-turn-helix transcriptional regulator n=1 Tax=Acinetobacter baumannii TaxID=470 RepID=UPI0032191A2E
MKWNEIGNQPCSIARTLSIIGDTWTILIIRNAFIGIRKFEDLQKNLGVTRHVLADRLKLLVDQGIFIKTPYTDTQKRYEYRLTKKGLDLYPIILSIVQWGNIWMDEGLGAPLDYYHKQCGHKFTPVTVCSECGKPIIPQEVQALPGPGFYAFYAKQNHQ